MQWQKRKLFTRQILFPVLLLLPRSQTGKNTISAPFHQERSQQVPLSKFNKDYISFRSILQVIFAHFCYTLTDKVEQIHNCSEEFCDTLCCPVIKDKLVWPKTFHISSRETLPTLHYGCLINSYGEQIMNRAYSEEPVHFSKVIRINRILHIMDTQFYEDIL